MFEKAVGPQTPLFSTAAASPKKKMDQKFHFHDSSVTLHFRNLQIPFEIKMTCNVELVKYWSHTRKRVKITPCEL